MRYSLSSVLALAGVVVASAFAASTAGAADPVCTDGQELIGDKCATKCPAGTVRTPGAFACVAVRQMLQCKSTEDSIGGKCVAKCPAGTVRATDGLACVATK